MKFKPVQTDPVAELKGRAPGSTTGHPRLRGLRPRDDRRNNRTVAPGRADPSAVPRRGSRLRGVAAPGPERARWRTDDELVMGPGESEAGGRGGWYSKI